MRHSKKNLNIRLLAVVVFFCAGSAFFLSPRPSEKALAEENLTAAATPTPRSRTRRTTTRRQPQPARPKKFSEFPHNIKQHQQACDSCHKFPTANWEKVRSQDAFPDVADFPQHESCLDCHRQQFFRGAPPTICSVCHTNPSPRASARHAFPNPREIFDETPRGKRAVSDFGIYFPHDKHADAFGSNDNPVERNANGANFVRASFAGARANAAEESCAVCHRTMSPQGDSEMEYLTKPPDKLGDDFWLKKGTFKSVPTSHAACFTCHSAETGILPAPNNCATCHKLETASPSADADQKLFATMGDLDRSTFLAWQRRDSSVKFRHEFFSHNELSCATCHSVTTMNTTVAATKKVKVMSCGGDGSGCHITPTADDGGILNFEVDARKKDAKFQCIKCHLNYGSAPVPESHRQAISALAPK